MRSRFCLNAATIKATSLERQIQLASAAGFNGIGLWLEDVEAALSRGKSLREISESLRDAALKVEEFCFLGGWQEADERGASRVMRDAERIFQVSQALGCDLVVAVPAQAAGFLESGPQRFRRVCQIAADFRVRVALEFVGTAAEVKNLRTAWHIVSTAGCENGGLVLDTFHFFMGGSEVEDLANLASEKIYLVHVSDAMNVPLEKLKTPHDWRTFPGYGIINFVPILEQLDRLGYQGAISLEIWNQQLHCADPADVVQRGFESLCGLEKLFVTGKMARQGER
jgi:4-hydroxyphenylpyruvate dioxygenase